MQALDHGARVRLSALAAPGALITFPCIHYRSGVVSADLTLGRGDYVFRWGKAGDAVVLQSVHVVYPADVSAAGGAGKCDG